MTDNPGVADTSLVEFGQTGQYPGTGQDAMPDWKKTAGFAPLETLPAAWFNGYMNELDTHINQLQNLTLQIQTEMANLMSAASVTPSGTNLTQIRQSIQKLIASANTLLIAPDFDPEVSYSVGQYVLYNEYLYICTTAHTGAWNSAHFSVTKVGTKLAELKTAIDEASGGGIAYSTTEFDTGSKWLAGEKIYGRVVDISSYLIPLSVASPITYNFDMLVSFKHLLFASSTVDSNTYVAYEGADFKYFSQGSIRAWAIYKDFLYLQLFSSSANICVYTADGQTLNEFPQNSINSFWATATKLLALASDTSILESKDGSTIDATHTLGFSANYICSFKGYVYVSLTTGGFKSTSDYSTWSAIPTLDAIFESSYYITEAIVFQDRLIVSGYDDDGTEAVCYTEDGVTFARASGSGSATNLVSFTIFHNRLYARYVRRHLYTSEDGKTFSQMSSIADSNLTALTSSEHAVYSCTVATTSFLQCLGYRASGITSALQRLLVARLLTSVSICNTSYARVAGDKLYAASDSVEGVPTQAIIEYTKQEA